MSTTTPRVYVACIAAYNTGHLHGAWIDANQDADDIHEQIRAMLKASPEPGAEEWAVHDYDDLPDFLGEYPDLDALATLGANVAEHGAAYIAFCKNSSTVEDESDFLSAYQGEHSSGQDFAYGLAEDLGQMPDGSQWPYSCIDWESAWRELEIGGDYWSEQNPSGGVWIFANN